MSRAEFCQELGRLWQPGDHMAQIGPTGRGKSTTLGQLIPHTNFDTAVLMCIKGKDPAYAHLGHPTRDWPPKMDWSEKLRILLGAPDRQQARPKVWRIEVPIRKKADMEARRAVFRRVLDMVYTRSENEKKTVLLVVDDAKVVAKDRLMMDAIVDGFLIGRSKKVSLVTPFQRPGLGMPREAQDQPTHVLLGKNRDRDTAKRLTEISGAVDPAEIMAAMGGLKFYEFLWIDGRQDDWFTIAES
jgi:hypothetical protein